MSKTWQSMNARTPETVSDTDNPTVIRLGIYWYNKIFGTKNKLAFGQERNNSVKKFLEKLSECDLYEAIDIAHRKVPVTSCNDGDTFRYFCGVAHNRIKNGRAAAERPRRLTSEDLAQVNPNPFSDDPRLG